MYLDCSIPSLNGERVLYDMYSVPLYPIVGPTQDENPIDLGPLFPVCSVLLHRLLDLYPSVTCVSFTLEAPIKFPAGQIQISL